jgi:tight adherence protein B
MTVGWLGAVACALVAGLLVPGTRDATLDRLAERPPGPGPARRRWPESVRERLSRTWRAAGMRAAIIELADAMAAELSSGAAPRAALHLAAVDHPLLSELAMAARSPASDVVAVLRAIAELPGGAGAGDLAAVWSVCERTGARLAVPVARLAGSLRDEEQIRREVSAQLAGPRATALLLAVLPGFGVAMGSALGADPLGLLFTTPLGLAFLLPGVALEVGGLLWTSRISRRASRV